VSFSGQHPLAGVPKGTYSKYTRAFGARTAETDPSGVLDSTAILPRPPPPWTADLADTPPTLGGAIGAIDASKSPLKNGYYCNTFSDRFGKIGIPPPARAYLSKKGFHGVGLPYDKIACRRRRSVFDDRRVTVEQLAVLAVLVLIDPVADPSTGVVHARKVGRGPV